jgi:hypothetical protein
VMSFQAAQASICIENSHRLAEACARLEASRQASGSIAARAALNIMRFPLFPQIGK